MRFWVIRQKCGTRRRSRACPTLCIVMLWILENPTARCFTLSPFRFIKREREVNARTHHDLVVGSVRVGVRRREVSVAMRPLWTEAEDNTIRRGYKNCGHLLLQRLPGRTQKGLQGRASRIGVRCGREFKPTCAWCSMKAVVTLFHEHEIEAACAKCAGQNCTWEFCSRTYEVAKESVGMP